MRYPVLIEEGTEATAFGVVVPDLPGCFSAGDTLCEAMAAAKEAATGWIDATLTRSPVIPLPSTSEAVRQLCGYEGWIIGYIDLDDPATPRPAGSARGSPA
ncbi:type II toxin-antitoxin system HicB family antitoxin [Reyranella sp.]|uniref:type II toxin-antitoxin system HicB family antitoxin n=1 Tax=Reyranella sp. TaxID=1929291 RepID=UPI003D0E5072